MLKILGKLKKRQRNFLQIPFKIRRSKKPRLQKSRSNLKKYLQEVLHKINN
jgi:hypothetical protein